MPRGARGGKGGHVWGQVSNRLSAAPFLAILQVGAKGA